MDRLRSRRNKLPRLQFDRAYGRYPLRFGGPSNHPRVPNGHPPIMTGEGPEQAYPRHYRITTFTLPVKANFADTDTEYWRFYYRDHDAEEHLDIIFDKDGGGLPPGAGFAIDLSSAVTASDVTTAVDAVLNGPGLSAFFTDHGVDIDINVGAATVAIRELPENTLLEWNLPLSTVVALTRRGNYLAEVAPTRAGPVGFFGEVAVE